MKKTLGAVLLLAGFLMLGVACFYAPGLNDAVEMAIAFVPGAVLAGLGLTLRRSGIRAEADAENDADEPSDAEDLESETSRDPAEAVSAWYRKRAAIGIFVGVAIIWQCISTFHLGQEFLPFIFELFVVGFALIIWGCADLARSKGLSSWLGFLGYLTLVGAGIIYLLPKGGERLMFGRGFIGFLRTEPFSIRDETHPGIRRMVLLAPLGILLAWFEIDQYRLRCDVPESEWKQIDGAKLGFRAQMPGTASEDRQSINLLIANTEVCRFRVSASDGRDHYEVLVMQQTLAPASDSEHKDALRLAMNVYVEMFKGKLVSSRQFTIAGVHALDGEVQAEDKVLRIRFYSQKTRLYGLIAIVPPSRRDSNDVRKFLDSFEMMEAADGTPKGGR